MELRADEESDRGVSTGVLVDDGGNSFPIRDGIPDLVYPRTLSESDQKAKDEYDATAGSYDANLGFLFGSLKEDEEDVRRKLIALLDLQPGNRVLEVGCGTGRDSDLIAECMKGEGRLFLQDLSHPMLEICRQRMEPHALARHYATSNGAYLPFASRSLDRVFHFGGINTFAEIGQAFREFTRVTKVGGTVVVGDESMPPWRRDTPIGQMLMNTNPLYKYPLPLEHLPECAKDVEVRWIISGVFYVIKYVVGDGPPTVDLDYEIPGRRGGTYRTRYLGQLEGVSEGTKTAAIEASAKSGKSVHKWLDEVVDQAAQTELKRD